MWPSPHFGMPNQAQIPIQKQFPLCPSSLDPLISSNVPGCRSCSRNVSSTDLTDRFLTKVNFYPQISSFLDIATVPAVAPVAPAQPPAPVPAPAIPARPVAPRVVDALPVQSGINPTQDARHRGTVRNDPSQRASRPQPRPQPLIQPLPAPDRRHTNARPR